MLLKKHIVWFIKLSIIYKFNNNNNRFRIYYDLDFKGYNQCNPNFEMEF